MCVKIETFPKLICTKENKISVKISESENTMLTTDIMYLQYVEESCVCYLL